MNRYFIIECFFSYSREIKKTNKSESAVIKLQGTTPKNHLPEPSNTQNHPTPKTTQHPKPPNTQNNPPKPIPKSELEL